MTALSTVAYTRWHEEKPRRRKKRLLHDQPALLWGLGPSPPPIQVLPVPKTKCTAASRPPPGLLLGRRRHARGTAPLPRPEPDPHLPPPAGSQRGGAGLCGAEGSYILRRGGQQRRPLSHPPAGSLRAEGWRPRSRLSTELGGGGRETR